MMEKGKVVLENGAEVELLDFKFNVIEDIIYSSCYFCGFSKIIHRHHIITKQQGGLNEEDNYLNLCPNCHGLIHRKFYFLQYSNGYFLMVDHNDHNKKIPPHKNQIRFKGKCPFNSISTAIKKKTLYINKNGKK